MSTIGWAIDQVCKGAKVRRKGWGDGERMYLHMSPPNPAHPDFAPSVELKDGDKFQPWLSCECDVLASDWEIWEAAT